MLAETVFAVRASGGGTSRCCRRLLRSVYALAIAVSVVACVAGTAFLRGVQRRGRRPSRRGGPCEPGVG